MANDALLNQLVNDLRPTRRRGPLPQIAWLAGLALVELAGFAGLGTTRPDIVAALSLPAFWWKLVSLALLALVGLSLAIRSSDPGFSPRAGLRGLVAIVGAVLISGWLIDAQVIHRQSLAARLAWQMGIQCLEMMAVLSIPPIIALGMLLRRGAPTDQPGSAWAAGAGAAGWGAFIFAFHCPSDDPLYIVVWYALGCGLIVTLARLILPLTSRW